MSRVAVFAFGALRDRARRHGVCIRRPRRARPRVRHRRKRPIPFRCACRRPAKSLDLRIADTIAKREYGLMCVRALPPRTGMIFVFSDGDNQRDFWMKNTLIPLDMVWVSKNGLVNDVAANVPSTTIDTPDAEIPHRDGTGTYVIELAAGEAARAGIKPGVMLAIRGVRATRE